MKPTQIFEYQGGIRELVLATEYDGYTYTEVISEPIDIRMLSRHRESAKNAFAKQMEIDDAKRLIASPNAEGSRAP